MNTFDKFALAERAEQLFANVYGLLAKQFAHEPKYYALFTQLEQEEIQHAMRIKMLRKRYTTKDVGDIEFDVVPLQAFLKNGERIMQQLESGEPFDSVSEAAAVMAELERQFAGAHAEMILSVVDSNLRKFFEQLAKQDRGHASLLH